MQILRYYGASVYSQVISFFLQLPCFCFSTLYYVTMLLCYYVSMLLCYQIQIVKCLALAKAEADPCLCDITHLLALDPGLGCYQGAVGEREEEEEEEEGGGRVVHGSGSGSEGVTGHWCVGLTDLIILGQADNAPAV